MSQWKSFLILKGVPMTAGLGVAAYKDRLYMGYQNANYSQNAMYIGSFGWANNEPVNYQSEQPPGWTASGGIGMTVFRDQIFMAYEGTGSGGIYIAFSFDGQTWSTKKHLADWDSAVGLGLVTYKEQMFMIYQGTGSGGIYVASSGDGENWKTIKHLPNWGAKRHVGLTVFNNKLYLAYQGTGSGGIYLATSDDGIAWTSNKIEGWEASRGIGMAAHKGKLWMAYEGTGGGNRLYVASSATPGGQSSDWETEQIDGWDADGGLGMAPFAGQLFMIYEGSGSGGTYAGVHP